MLQMPNAETLLRGAELETGLSDWRTEHTGEPFEALEILVKDLQQHSRLHELGVRRMYRRLHEVLCSRLKYIADRKRYPGLAEEKIEQPIFILGLPRSGTTFLHNFLGSDPENRAPHTAEMLFPAPKLSDPLARELRVQMCHESMTYMGMMDDVWQSVHPFGAARPDECIFIWELSLITALYPAFGEMPNYEKYAFSYDYRKIYREQRDFLRYLQHKEGHRRWVLKAPIHVAFLEELFDTFPDAWILHSHRDPAKIYPSIVSMIEVSRSMFSDLLPDTNAGSRSYDDTWQRALEFRKRPGMAERFVDIHFLETQADPVTAVERMYEKIGRSLSVERRQVMEQWLSADSAEHKSRPRHRYDIASSGLTLEDIDRENAEYVAAFGVLMER